MDHFEYRSGVLHAEDMALPQIAEAAASFDSAAKLAPTLDEAWRNAGTAYQHLGQPDIAEGARALQSSVHAAES